MKNIKTFNNFIVVYRST